MATPLKQKTRRNFCDVLSDWQYMNGYEPQSLFDVLESTDLTPIFGIEKVGDTGLIPADVSKTVALYFMQCLCEHYWYFPVGFPIDEHFIAKFKATWYNNITMYTQQYYRYVYESPFLRHKEGSNTHTLADGYTLKNTYTPNLTYETEGETKDTRTGERSATSTGEHNDTSVKEREGTETQTRDRKTTSDGEDSASVSRETSVESTIDETDVKNIGMKSNGENHESGNATETLTKDEDTIVTNFGANVSDTAVTGTDITTKSDSKDTTLSQESTTDETDTKKGTANTSESLSESDSRASHNEVTQEGTDVLTHDTTETITADGATSGTESENTTDSSTGTSSQVRHNTGSSTNETSRDNRGNTSDEYYEDITDFTVEKLRLIGEASNIVEDFVYRFDKLFKQVYNYI